MKYNVFSFFMVFDIHQLLLSCFPLEKVCQGTEAIWKELLQDQEGTASSERNGKNLCFFCRVCLLIAVAKISLHPFCCFVTNILPCDKQGELVEYYYTWKKTPTALSSRPHRRRRHNVLRRKALPRSSKSIVSEFGK